MVDQQVAYIRHVALLLKPQLHHPCAHEDVQRHLRLQEELLHQGYDDYRRRIVARIVYGR